MLQFWVIVSLCVLSIAIIGCRKEAPQSKADGGKQAEYTKPVDKKPVAKESAKPEQLAELIVGKWEGKHNGNAAPISIRMKEGTFGDLIERYEFEKGGKYVRTVDTPGHAFLATQKGEYRIIDEKTLEVAADNPPGTKYTWSMTVTKDALVLVYAGSDKKMAGTSKLTRQK